MRDAIYFMRDHEGDQVIVRHEIEFKFALQYFHECQKFPNFKIWFEDGDDDENTHETIQVSPGIARRCLRVNSTVPTIDY